MESEKLKEVKELEDAKQRFKNRLSKLNQQVGEEEPNSIHIYRSLHFIKSSIKVLLYKKVPRSEIEQELANAVSEEIVKIIDETVNAMKWQDVLDVLKASEEEEKEKSKQE